MNDEQNVRDSVSAAYAKAVSTPSARGASCCSPVQKGVVVKLAPPQVTEALKIQGAKRQPDDGDPHSREFVEIPVSGPREVERAMMWLRRACRLGRTAAGPV